MSFWETPDLANMAAEKIDFARVWQSAEKIVLRNNLVDEIHLFVVPTTIGNGIPVIPVLPKDVVLRLELMEKRRFSEGWIYLRYRIEKKIE